MDGISGKKVCVVVKALSKGGAERSASILTYILSDLGHEVFVVSVLNEIDYKFKGTLFNLGVDKESQQGVLGRLNRFWKLFKYIRKHQFDYIIDNRTRVRPFQELLLAALVYPRKKTIYCVRSFNIKNYISENQFLAKRTYARAYKIVAVSRMVKEKIEHEYGFSNVMEINNPIEPMDLERGSEAVLSQDYILYFGRLDEKVKHLTLLIDAYSESKLSDKGVSLVIMGSGPDEEFLKAYANTKKTCSLIKFIEFNPFPASTIKRALFTVLTSRWEGFPRMILESLSLGVPVLSVKCKSGPEELIVHEENGLLVMNNNIQALALGMDRLISDEALYKHCKRNAQRSIKPYSLEQISQKWQMILK